jgi:hypothetical protein
LTASSSIDFTSANVDKKGRIKYVNSTNLFQIFTNNNLSMEISESGVNVHTNLPFNSTTPLASFYDDVDREIAIGGLGIYRRDGGTNADLRINYLGYNGGTSQFRDLDIYDGKSQRIAMFQGSTHNVGIGTTSPSQKLDVQGNINCSGTIYGSIYCIWAEENHNLKDLRNGGYCWAFGNGADTDQGLGVAIAIKSQVIAMSFTRLINSGSPKVRYERGNSVTSKTDVTNGYEIQVNNGNYSAHATFDGLVFTAGNRLNFKTTSGGTSTVTGGDNVVCVWLKVVA